MVGAAVVQCFVRLWGIWGRPFCYTWERSLGGGRELVNVPSVLSSCAMTVARVIDSTASMPPLERARKYSPPAAKFPTNFRGKNAPVVDSLVVDAGGVHIRARFARITL